VIRWLVAATCLVVGTTHARAEKLALRDAHGEADVADETTALGFLVRSAFAKDARTLVGPVPEDLTVPAAAALLISLHADHAVMIELSRDGTGLRATIAVVDPDGLLIVTHASAGDGDLVQLAQRVVDKIAGITHAPASPVPAVSLGVLRPYTLAARTHDSAPLVDAVPTVALAVRAIGPALAALPGTTLSARALGSATKLDALPADDLAAHAFARIARSEITEADAILGKPVKGESFLVVLARATLADVRNDVPGLQRLIAAGLASDQPRAMLAFMASLPRERLTPELLRTAIALLPKAGATAGVVARLGLLAAELGVDGALDLIAVRELDDAELSFLIPLIEVEPTPTILRLRAEVSMRRADGHQATAIGAFLAAAPNDVRAHLDHAYALMAGNKRAEAAAEFDAAGNQRLHARALFLGGDLAEATKNVDKPTSAEELALAALTAKRVDDAAAFADRADKLAPASPLVQRVVGLVADRRGDTPRAKLARQIADEGNAPAYTLAAAADAPPPPPPTKPTVAPSAGPAPRDADDGDGPPIVPIAIAGGAGLIGAGVLVFVLRRRRRPAFVPVPTSDEPPPLQQLVIEPPPMPAEPEAEPFADFPFALDPEPAPEPPPEVPPEELELAPPAEELVLEDQVPANPIAVSFRPSLTPVPPAGPLDLGFEESIVESMPGLVLDRYRTTRELGRGAMGVVYRAWDQNLEREVAIKVMAEELRTNAEAMQLFTQEAKSLAQLNHANIVTIYDQVTIQDKVYMIMELVDGTTLEDTMLKKKFGWREASALADQLCAGLAYAHARKIIHRDIKPANIFMTNDGGIKLGDFGLARVMRELKFRATEVRGTPLYMAPEQITGTDIDHRTDLYAVGCTLYEMVTGRPPFIDGDIMYQQVHTNPIPVSMLVTGVPKLLERLIMSLLAKQLDERPRTANEVRSVIKSVS